MKYIKGFNSLRAISIIFVMLTHLGLYSKLPKVDFIRERVWILISGDTGVQIFFTLSGFLITTILINEKVVNSRINIRNFYIRRFLRLTPPLMIFYLTIGVLMCFHLINPNRPGLLLSIFYLYNFIPEYLYTVEIGHTWSLAVEEQFYFTWPVLMMAF